MTVVQVSHALVMLSCISHSSEYNIFVLYIIYNYMHVCVGHGKECQLVIHVYTCAVAYPGGGGGGGIGVFERFEHPPQCQLINYSYRPIRFTTRARHERKPIACALSGILLCSRWAHASRVLHRENVPRMRS